LFERLLFGSEGHVLLMKSEYNSSLQVIKRWGVQTSRR
jgi:hypothetical protein